MRAELGHERRGLVNGWSRPGRPDVAGRAIWIAGGVK